MPQKSRNPMLRMGAVSPPPGHFGPIWALCCPILILCRPILNICCPILAGCWPKKRRNAKTMEKPMDSQGFGTHVEAMLDQLWDYVGPSWGYVGPSWGYVGPSWRYVGPSWALCWPILGLCWPGLRLCWPNLQEEMPEDEQKFKRKQKCRKKNQNPMLRRPRPEFAPGSPQVPPRLYCFRGGRSAAGAASLYNLRLLPKASGKGTGEPSWPAPGLTSM